MGRLARHLCERGIQPFIIGATDTKAAREATAAFQNVISILVDTKRRTYLRYGFTKTAGIIQKSGIVVIDSSAIIQYVHRTSNPRKSFNKEEVLKVVEQLA